MTSEILLGYVVGSGEAVSIPLRHTAVTGQTQESGKTTTLEGLISRSGLQAIAYVTKRGESSFHVAQPIPPYFQERADWKFVQSLLEASTESKLKFEQSWIMRASEGAKTLADVQSNIRRFLNGVRDDRPVKLRKGTEPKERWLQKPARGLSCDVYYVLNKYLDDIMPELAAMPYTTRLELADGLNVMDLRDYDFPLQALVVRSVTDYIRQKAENTINIIPEAWKFAPKFRGSPVRLAAEEYVREAAAMKNFLWIDSQDLAGVADVLMRQVGVWLFGVQRATREIYRALEHMPEGLPARRPRPADIATLSKGQFYVCFGREMHKVYVQPAWMTAAHAEAIARGEEEVDSAREILREYDKGAKHGGSVGSDAATARQNRGGAVAADADGESVPLPDLRKRGRSQRNSPAFDSGSLDTDTHAAQSAEGKEAEEEAMWKEKYEALKADFDRLAADHARLIEECDDLRANGKRGPGFDTPILQPQNSNLEAVYAYVKERAAKDPGVLQLLTQQPELRVTVQRKTVEADGSTLRGRLALLISKKFFDSPQNGNTAFNELKRIGFPCAKPNVYRELDKLAELGFVTKEETGYQAIAGMKINIVEG